jgi:hypothetical protein
MEVIDAFPRKFIGEKLVLKDISRVDDRIKDSIAKLMVLQGKARAGKTKGGFA